MKKKTSSIRTKFHRVRGWSKGLAPYVARTVSLQRPLANFEIQRATACSGIDEYFPLTVNGHEQWLRIRGEQVENPVILYLHGGPGGSQIPSYRHYQLDWEQDFTIVHWEQRGAGKSYSNKLDVATMTLPALVADTLAVIDYLSNRFDRKDIVLLGHSWGTFLGIHVLQKRPRYVSSYFGVGQVSNQIESERRMHEFALRTAEDVGDQRAIDQLSKLRGYPLVKGAHANVASVREWARHFGYLGSGLSDTARTYERLMETPEYGLADIYRFLKGTLISFATLGRTMLSDAEAQPTALPSQFDVPVFLISGRRDHFTPTDLADEYLSTLRAPETCHVVFEESGHYPNEDAPDRFLATLKEHVQPYLIR